MSACRICSKADGELFACKGCRQAIYCSQNHATEDWPEHQMVCSEIGRDIPTWTSHLADGEMAPIVKTWFTVPDIDQEKWNIFHFNTLVDEGLSNMVDCSWNSNKEVVFYYIRYGTTPGQLVLVFNKANLYRLIVDRGAVFNTDNAGTARNFKSHRVYECVGAVLDNFEKTMTAKLGLKHRMNFSELTAAGH